MKKTLLLLCTFCLIGIATKAQDFAFGTFTQEEMSMKKYAKDTSAHALVLNEHGRAEIMATSEEDINLVYEYHVKIKIFDKTAFDEGSIELPFYIEDGQTFEQITDIKGITIAADENGMISKTELDANKIYTTKESKHISRLKFALPGLREGCIIEYSYRLVSPYYRTFHSWQFQSNIPKIYSEYDTHIPAYWNFNVSLVGDLKLTKNVGEAEKDCFNFHGAKSNCSHFIYGMSDIPAFIVEDDMTSPKNFVSAIHYELSDYYDLSNGANLKVAKSWGDVDYDFKHAPYFGSQLRKTSLFKDRIAPVIAGKTDDLDKAKAIYAYIKKAIKWNEGNDYGSVDGLHSALDNHTGNAAEVNLSLVVALNAAGLNAEAVLLSTRENGIVNKLYPAASEFNYVIAKLNIGDKSYLLDATDPMLTFGMLPLRCLNDQGRVMSLDKPSYWIDLVSPLKQINTINLNLTLQPDGKIKGELNHFSIGYAAYEKRKEIKKSNSTDEYVEGLSEKSKFKIHGSDISGLDSLDQPVSEKYEVEAKEYDNMDNDHFKFNLFLTGRIDKNPFKLQERTYPVDWGMPSETRFTLVMHLPADYTLEANPQDVNLALPNKGGNFITNFSADGNTITFSYEISLNKSVYAPVEYPYLKEFFTKIILAEKAAIMFKKKM